MSDRADILRRIQTDPGRWTIDDLSAATGKTPRAIASAVVSLVRAGDIERPEPIDLFDPETGFHTVTFQPTRKTWIDPCRR